MRWMMIAVLLSTAVLAACQTDGEQRRGDYRRGDIPPALQAA